MQGTRLSRTSTAGAHGLQKMDVLGDGATDINDLVEGVLRMTMEGSSSLDVARARGYALRFFTECRDLKNAASEGCAECQRGTSSFYSQAAQLQCRWAFHLMLVSFYMCSHVRVFF